MHNELIVIMLQQADHLTGAPVQQVHARSRIAGEPDHLIVVISGERGIIEPALRAANLGPVVVVDADGRPKP